MTEAAGTMMPTVLVVGNYLADQQSSMLRYNQMLADALSDQSRTRLVRPPHVFGALMPGFIGQAIDKYLLAPVRLAIRRDDIAVISDQGMAFYALALRSRRRVVVCHDLIAHRAMGGQLDGWRPSRLGRWLQKANLAGLRNADHIVCISEATRQDLMRIAGVPPEQITTILNCLPPDLFEAAIKQQARTRTSDVLCYATSFYKNIGLSLRAFALARDRLPASSRLLVIGHPEPQAIQVAVTLGLQDHVDWLGRVGDDELFDLYATAGVLLFPSLAEGFGWPVIEAQAFGAPVVTSDAGSLPEVAGDGAVICPLDDAAVSEALVAVLTDRSLSELLAKRGAVNVQRFTPTVWRQAYGEFMQGVQATSSSRR